MTNNGRFPCGVSDRPARFLPTTRRLISLDLDRFPILRSNWSFIIRISDPQRNRLTMSDQSQTAQNSAAEPVMCKMGCGFFGNNATDGCCSKCWRDKQKKEGSPAEDATPMEIVEEKPNEATKTETAAVEEKPAGELKPTETKKKKKKKKKASYKNMMAGMMHTSDSRDIDKEKERINKVTGGGAFTKIDKI